jgi:hypothetical protein
VHGKNVDGSDKPRDDDGATVIARSAETKQSSFVSAKLDCFAALAMTVGTTNLLRSIKHWNRAAPYLHGVKNYADREISFSIFVDAIFTTFIASLFTKVFDAETRSRGAFLRVSRAPRRLTPRQPKFDTNKKDRITRMYCVRSSVNVV